MLPSRLSHRAAAVALVLLALGSACSRSLAPFAANQRPVVELRSSPTRSEGSQSIAYRIEWSGSDADGSVSHYEYAIDPPSAAQAAAGRETTWVRTDLREYSLEFGRTREASDKRALRERHTFVVRAIDMSADPSTRASAPQAWVLDEVGVAPTVQITSPVPSALLSPRLAPPVDVTWQGHDPDGEQSTAPVGYRHRLFGPGDQASIAAWIMEPDSLRRYFEPSGYAGWDSSGAGVSSLSLDSLAFDADYLFVIIAVDETGATTGSFSLSTNMLRFSTGPASSLVPSLSVGFGFDSYRLAPTQNADRFEVPAGRVIEFTWFATPPVGGRIKGYNWALDPQEFGDDHGRENEETDWHRWSRASLSATTARIGPFAPGENHRLYIQVFDHGGRRGLYQVTFSVVDVPLNRDLLIVDDTRLRGDMFLAGSGGQCLQPYPTTIAWPAAAELDTFLYAVGGVPWRGVAANCPAPTGTPVLSTPGIFAGYDYDTLGTRRGFETPSNSTPLSLLTQYRHIIWMVDIDAATSNSIFDPLRPMTALRYMNSVGNSSALDAYIGLGGKVWFVGAGAPLASMIAYNRVNNDQGLFGIVFSDDGAQVELRPGRVMFDRFHWKTEFVVGRSSSRIRRSHSLDRPGELDRPGYADLPLELRRKTPATDAMPPTRAASATSSFYQATKEVAYLSTPNFVIEDIDSDPSVVNEQSTLDTLYALDASGGNLHPSGSTFPRPAMTYYRGPSGPPSVVSGFAIWNLARADAQALADFVLGDLWQLPRQGKFARRAVALSERRPR